jgi:hypothetical protein
MLSPTAGTVPTQRLGVVQSAKVELRRDQGQPAVDQADQAKRDARIVVRIVHSESRGAFYDRRLGSPIPDLTDVQSACIGLS